MKKSKILNVNFNSNNQLFIKNLNSYSYLDIQLLLETYTTDVLFHEEDNIDMDQGQVLEIQSSKFVVTYFQDADNEGEENIKRIQRTHINKAKELQCSLMGIYPILAPNNIDINDYLFAVWEYDLVSAVSNGKNPSVKIRLNTLCNEAYGSVPNNLKKPKKALRYEPGVKYFFNKDIDTYLTKKHQLHIEKNELQKKIEAINQKEKLETLDQEEAEILLASHVRNSKIQKMFREKLLSNRNSCCQLCSIDKPELLVASHIYPVKSIFKNELDNNKRIDMIIDQNNGLLLCPTHDKLFDSGYISFTENGKIIISKEIQKIKSSLHVDENLSISTKTFDQKYMKYHLDNIFKK